MGAPSSHEVIIVVDDEEFVRAAFGDMLRTLGYTVLTATDGEHALSVMSEHGAAIHLVVSDITMPAMDGLEFAALVRAAYPALPVLLVSGESPTFLMDNRERVPEGTFFLGKPVSLGALAHQVRVILDSQG
jgi:CheY-like chemotaxis protein